MMHGFGSRPCSAGDRACVLAHGLVFALAIACALDIGILLSHRPLITLFQLICVVRMMLLLLVMKDMT